MSNFFSLQLKPKRGFTLIELMIAISIIAIVSAVGLVTYNNTRMIARDAKRKQDLKAIAQALELFYLEYRRYPCHGISTRVNSLDTNTTWLTDSSDIGCVTATTGGTGFKLSPAFMSSVPRDPLNTTSYKYEYHSSAANGLGSPPCLNQDFILIAYLENTNDADTALKKPRTICGSIVTNTFYGDNAYVIKMP
jgi:prepilin-type N-terminal cleavage/methylation domain-containing protein